MISVPEAWQLPRMPGSLALAIDRLRQLGGKGRHGLREIAPVEGHRHAGDLPVAGRRVLAAGDLLCRAVEGAGKSVPAAEIWKPVAVSAALPRPSDSICGSAIGPLRRPSRSARPAAQASTMCPSVSAPASPKLAQRRRLRRCRRNPERREMRAALGISDSQSPKRRARHRVCRRRWQIGKCRPRCPATCHATGVVPFDDKQPGPCGAGLLANERVGQRRRGEFAPRPVSSPGR